MLSDCDLSCPVLSVCLSVSDVRALWPNCWTDQNETWHESRSRPWPHCVRWGPSSPPPQPTPQFSVHICCGQMAAWITMPLGMELGLGPGDLVLNGDPAPPPQKTVELPNFRPMFIVAKQLDGSRWHLARRWSSAQATLC